MEGGTLHFKMTSSPSDWATNLGNAPKTEITEHLIVSSPFIAKGDVAFKVETDIVLDNADKDASIFYRLGDKGGFKKYENSFSINQATTLSVYSEKKGAKSKTITTDFFKIDPNLSITLETKYANQYNAGGNEALIDGILGTRDFRTGTWQGYSDQDLIATVDLGSLKPVSSVTVRFLQDQRSWIFYPTEVLCLVSKDGKNFKILESKVKIDTAKLSEPIAIKTIEFKQSPIPYRYVKIIAKKLGTLPKWHLGHKHDGRSWLFVDEISVK
jgi:hypothetical protein